MPCPEVSWSIFPGIAYSLYSNSRKVLRTRHFPQSEAFFVLCGTRSPHLAQHTKGNWVGRGLFIHTHSQQTPKSEPKWFVVSAWCPEYSSTVREVVLILQRRRKKKTKPTKQNTEKTKAEHCSSAWNDWKQLKPTSPPHGKHRAREGPRGLPASSAACTWAWATLSQERKSFCSNTQSLSVLREIPRRTPPPLPGAHLLGEAGAPVRWRGALLPSRRTGECSSRALTAPSRPRTLCTAISASCI